jgi:hypothetical protein
MGVFLVEGLICNLNLILKTDCDVLMAVTSKWKLNLSGALK